jgi:CubicO group peptidase (beta-lactamase class C family)
MIALPPAEEFQQKLDGLTGQFIAGASLAVVLGDDVREAASGVVNIDTRVEATPDSIFQIGSITKIYTATLIMQLVDAGRIDLDAPARTYLPELRFGDASAADAVTVRHLLTHTSGIDGDFFDDFGRGDDCVERYVAACERLPSLFAPGAMWSYCNAGFVVLGRIVERLTGTTWDRALRTCLLDPAGLRATVTLPEEALMFRAAAGHFLDPSLSITRAPRWDMPRSQGPAGSNVCATTRDLLAFARLHMDGGVAADGKQLLSPAAVCAMQEPWATLPSQPGASADHWGLGWMLFDWSGRRVVGHDGGTIGQQSSLRLLPDERFAVALLTNTSPSGGAVAELVMSWLFKEMFDIDVPPRPQPPEQAPHVDPAPYTGVFEKLGARTTLEVSDGALYATAANTGPLPLPDMPPARLYPVDASLFLEAAPFPGYFTPVTFSDFDGEGHPRYMFTASRVSRRIG